jgi:hypothetical protein
LCKAHASRKKKGNDFFHGKVYANKANELLVAVAVVEKL